MSGVEVCELLEDNQGLRDSVSVLSQLGKAPRYVGGTLVEGFCKRRNDEFPLVTIVTVVFDGESSIEATIQSVINQSYTNFEYIIVDGGSRDGTVDKIREYDNYIDLWISDKDAGIYDAMNKAITLASGEWLNFMNCGDVFTSKEIVADIVALSQKEDENISVIYSDTFFEFNSGVETFVCEKNKMKVIHQSIFYKKYLHEKYGLKYLVYNGFTTSDYLFFKSIASEHWFKCDFNISKCSPYGISSGEKTFRNKWLLNLMLDNISNSMVFAMICVHPFYRFLKILLRKLIFSRY